MQEEENGKEKTRRNPSLRYVRTNKRHKSSYLSIIAFQQSDWEESSEEEESEEEKPAVAAPPKKKGTLKAKLAEKEAMKAAANDDGSDEYDSDAVLDPREKARRDKERELKADMDNAAALFGAAGLGGEHTKHIRCYRL